MSAFSVPVVCRGLSGYLGERPQIKPKRSLLCTLRRIPDAVCQALSIDYRAKKCRHPPS